MNKKKIAIIIAAAVAAFILIVVGVVFVVLALNKDEGSGVTWTPEKENSSVVADTSDDVEDATIEQEEPETVEDNTIVKLQKAYETGMIDINTYLTQMTYAAYDGDKLDSAYKSDTNGEFDIKQFGLEEFYTANESKLSDEAKKTFFSYYFMLNINHGVNSTGETSTEGSTESSTESAAQQLTQPVAAVSGDKTTGQASFASHVVAEKEIDKSNKDNHTLNKVVLSSKGNFLVWYAEKGEDAITKDRAVEIAEKLEETVVLYEQIFGIKYEYKPYMDFGMGGLFSDKAKFDALLIMNGYAFSTDVYNAMNVYVYDMGDTGALAQHMYIEDFGQKLLLDLGEVMGIKDQDIAFPNIRINRSAMGENNDSVYQVVVHELFHQFQHSYAESKTGKRAACGNVILETAANYASACANKATTTDNFLNHWSAVYTRQTFLNLKSVTTSGEGNTGYAIFPYMKAYADNVTGAHKIIMDAHTYENALGYMHQQANATSLVNTINQLAYSNLAQDYTNAAYISADPVQYNDELENNKTYNKSISIGAIVYYKLDKYMTLKVSATDTTYLRFHLFGKKGSTWTKIIDNATSLDIDAYDYKDYEELYMCATNGSLIADGFYVIEMGSGTAVPNNSTFNTSFSNYKMTVNMTFAMSGIETVSTSTGVMDELHQKQYLKTSTSAFGMTLTSMETYTDFDAGCTYTSVPNPVTGQSQWTKDKSVSQIVDIKNVLKMLSSMENVEKVSDSQYRIKMSSSEVQGLMKNSDVDASAVAGTVDVDVYVSNGYITKMEYDFSKMFTSYNKFKTTITFSDYNSAGDVNIPQSVVDSAVTSN